MIRDLQVKIGVLTKRSKNTGVIFDRQAFSSKAKFAIWFIKHDERGEGLAAWMDIISIWAFGTVDHINTTQWLTEIHQSKTIGLKESVDMAYAHSMSTQYPMVFVGASKDQIWSSTTIKMLESYKVWHENGGGGDGVKVRLSDMMQNAVRCHCHYCEDFVPEGKMQAMALKTANASSRFWMNLAYYIEDEYSFLLSFNLDSKHILLLLSNQIVQMCDDIHKFRRSAANVDVMDRAMAAARFAWVMLQAHTCMNGYLEDKFKHHASINNTFVFSHDTWQISWQWG
jgi:hypothetical protein